MAYTKFISLNNNIAMGYTLKYNVTIGDPVLYVVESVATYTSYANCDKLCYLVKKFLLCLLTYCYGASLSMVVLFSFSGT